MQLEFPMMDGGPNGRSLIEQQEIFAKVNSPRELVDPEWHKLDPATDVFLDWGSGEDSEKWREFRSGEGQRDNRYYWRKDYWLRAARKQS